MKAAVFHSPGNITCDTIEDPKIQDENDIILRVTSTVICTCTQEGSRNRDPW